MAKKKVKGQLCVSKFFQIIYKVQVTFRQRFCNNLNFFPKYVQKIHSLNNITIPEIGFIFLGLLRFLEFLYKFINFFLITNKIR